MPFPAQPINPKPTTLACPAHPFVPRLVWPLACDVGAGVGLEHRRLLHSPPRVQAHAAMQQLARGDEELVLELFHGDAVLVEAIELLELHARHLLAPRGADVLLQVAPPAPENGHVRGVERAFPKLRATLRSP